MEATTTSNAEARFVPEWMLDGDWPDIPPQEQFRLVHAQLLRLRSLDAQLSEMVGRGLARLTDGHAYRKLFFSRIRDFVEARFGFCIGTAYELRDLDVLREFPIVRAAYLGGDLCVSKVRALLKIVTRDTQAGWVGYAQRNGTRVVERDVADTLRARKDGATSGSAPAPSGEPDAPRRWSVVSWLATRTEAAAWHYGLEMMRTIAGEELPTWRLAELVAEGSGLVADLPEPEPPSSDAEPKRRRRRRPHVVTDVDLAWHATRRTITPPVAGLDVADPCDAEDPWAITERIEAIQRIRCALDFERSVLLSFLDGRRLTLLHGYRTVAAYAADCLGMSGKDCRAALDLQLQSCVSPEFTAAWREGLLASVVSMIAQVATPTAAPDWICFARLASRKRLVLEVRWHEAALIVLGRARYLELTGGVPDESAVESQRLLQWQTFMGLREAEVADAEPGDPQAEDLKSALDDALVPISFRAPEDVATLFRAVVEEHRAQSLAGSGRVLSFGAAVHSLLVQAAHEHDPNADRTPAGRRRVREHRVLERDGWRCSSPLCTSRRALHVHHVQWRSRGGSDEDANLSGPCVSCHPLVHDGKTAELTGTAPDGLTFRVGKRPDGSWRETWRNGLRVTQPQPELVHA